MQITTHKPKPGKLCMIHSFARHEIAAFSRRIRRFVSGEEIAFVDRRQYAIPDSNICRKAITLVQDCSPPFLFNHCLRSHALAVALGTISGKRYDREVLFLGSIMHDLGLTHEHDGEDTFEIEGARAALDFCQKNELPQQAAHLVHEMVALHNSVGIADKKDTEIALLHFGAGADVVGLNIRDIHPNTVSEILEQHPLLDFRHAMADLIEDQVKRKPHSYMSTMVDLGFLRRMRDFDLAMDR